MPTTLASIESRANSLARKRLQQLYELQRFTPEEARAKALEQIPLKVQPKKPLTLEQVVVMEDMNL